MNYICIVNFVLTKNGAFMRIMYFMMLIVSTVYRME